MTEDVLVGIGKDGQRLELSAEDRSTHMHVLGASKRGKSKLLENLIQQDIEYGHGLCLIDPHGTLYDDLVSWCASERLAKRRKIHLIDPNDTDWTVGFDPLRCDDPELLSVTVDSAVDACAQVWGGEDPNKTPLLTKCLRSVFHALAATGRPFSDAHALVSTLDKEFRRLVTEDLDDPIFRGLWADFRALSPREFSETFSSTVNRLQEFLGNPIIRRMFSVKENTLDLRKCMDEGHIVLVNLKPKKISSRNARVIGTLLTNALFATAVRRGRRESEERPFYLYIDECYNFITSDIEAMLDQTRKFGLHVILAHQHLAQLRKHGEHVFNAVMTNAQTKVIFGGLSETDGEFLAKEVLRETFNYNQSKELLEKPTVVAYDMITLRNRGRALADSDSEGHNTSNGESGSISDSSSEAYDPWGFRIPGSARTETTGRASGITSGTGMNRSRSTSRTESEGESEALLPIFERLPTAVEGQEEIMNRAILRLRKLKRGLFVLARPDFDPVLTSAPRVESIEIRPDRVDEFMATVRAISPFTSTRAEAEAQAQRRQTKPPTDDLNDDPFSVPEG